MKILITGGTGMIGKPLCAHLARAGHELVVLTRQAADSTSYKTINDLSQIPEAENFDAVINLAGEPIADKPWSEDRKAMIYDSRLQLTTKLVTFVSNRQVKPRVFVSGSAIGYYGVGIDDDSITESGAGDGSFSHKLCADWEQEAMRASDEGVRVCLLRTGIVLGQGGALGKMLLPFKMGLGGKIGSGQQWMPWIHINDMINIISFCLTNESLSGPINCAAPKPVRNKEFSQRLGQALSRPTVLPMPAFAIKLMMGEMGEELLLSGKRVVPAKLLDAGFEFQFDEILPALNEVVGV